MAPLFVIAVFMLFGSFWFWNHCARPALVWRSAGPLTTATVLGVTIWSALIHVALIVLVLTSQDVPRWLSLVGGIPWLVIVGYGWTERYRTLLRLTGGR